MENDDRLARDIESLLLEKAENDRDPLLDFDKFMVGVVENQQRRNAPRGSEEDSPARKYNKLYGEHPHNRTKVRR